MCGALFARLHVAISLACVAVWAAAAALEAQQPGSAAGRETITVANIQRPIAEPLVPPPNIQRAIARGSRSSTGVPGSKYWQQSASYVIDATLDTARKRITGTAQIRHQNRSPDTIGSVYLQLTQNIFAPDGMRSVPEPVTEGMVLEKVMIDGREVHPQTGDDAPGVYQLYSTAMRMSPWKALAPGDSVRIDVRYHYEVPLGAARQGRSRDGLLYVIAYWYPQLAVFDDLRRWNAEPHIGIAEFYQDFADYDVTLHVPNGWLVAATGELSNGATLLPDTIRARLSRAIGTSETAVIARPGEEAARPTMSTWHFTAHDVRDFTWATSSEWEWDATRVVQTQVRGSGPDTLLSFAFFRPGSAQWRIASSSASKALTAVGALLGRRYAYSKFSAVEGPGSCGGMEYPMATCIDQRTDSSGLAVTILHEAAHSWMPMRVSSDEKRYPWMDEGLTRFVQDVIIERTSGVERWKDARATYLQAVKDGAETEIMREGDLFPPADGDVDPYSAAEYNKTSLAFRALRGMLGDSVFWRAYRTYATRWDGKHPTPWDLFNTFDHVAGQDLSWFWRVWFFETWKLDQAIGAVRTEHGALLVTIEDRGWMPMPVLLDVTYRDGHHQRMTLPVVPWLNGRTTQVARVPDGRSVSRIDIDPDEWFPDVDRTNQVWIASATKSRP